MAASPDRLIASCVISPSRDMVGVDVGALVGADEVGEEVVGIGVVGTGVEGATIGAGLVGIGLGAEVGLKVVGRFDGRAVGVLVATGVGIKEAITGACVSGSGSVGILVGGKVDGVGVVNAGARVGGDVTGLIVGVLVGFGIVGMSVAGPGPGSDDIAGALVGSRLVDSMVGLIVGSSNDADAGSLVGELSLEPEELDLLSDGCLRAFVLDDNEEIGDAFACFDDLLLFANLLDTVPFDILVFFRRRFFRCWTSFFRLFCRSFCNFALSTFLGNRFGILFLVLLLLLLLLVRSSRDFIR